MYEDAAEHVALRCPCFMYGGVVLRSEETRVAGAVIKAEMSTGQDVEFGNSGSLMMHRQQCLKFTPYPQRHGEEEVVEAFECTGERVG